MNQSFDFTDLTTFSNLDQQSKEMPKSFTKPWYPYILAWNIVAIIPAALGNLLPIFTYVKFESLRSPTSLLICNQSVTDVLAATQLFLYTLFNYTEWGILFASKNKYACLVMLANLGMSIIMSGVNLLLISAERLIAVLFPYKYYIWVTDKIVKRILVVVWIAVAILMSLGLFGWNTWIYGLPCLSSIVYPKVYMLYLILMNDFILLSLSALFNLIIARVAFKVNRVMAQASVATIAPVCENKDPNQKKKFKITQMLLMVVGVFYLSWAPYIVLTLIFLRPPSMWLKQGPPVYVKIMYELSKGMLLWNSVANPLIYAWKNSEYRRSFRRVLGLNLNGTNDSHVS